MAPDAAKPRVDSAVQDGSLSPGELIANLSAMGACGAYIGFTSERPGGMLSWLGLAAKVVAGGYVAGYMVLWAFGFLFAAYVKWAWRLPVSRDFEAMIDETNAILFPQSDEARSVARRRSCEVDHLVYTSARLEDGIEAIRDLTGIEPRAGGSHPGVGTHNALLSLGDCAYLEIIAPDPDMPDPDRPRPFGLDDDDENLGKLTAFAVHPNPATKGATIELIAQSMQLAGRHPGKISVMSRRRPTGSMLSWKLTSPYRAVGGQPFIIDWEGARSPAMTAPGGCKLVGLTCYEKNVDAMAELHRKIGLVEGPGGKPRVKVEVKKTDGQSYMVAEVDTPKGRVCIGALSKRPNRK